MTEPILGIDLGTTNSVAAVFENGKVRVLPNQEGDRVTPSIVAFKGREVLVGSGARRQAASNPELTFHSVKRWIGRPYEDVAEEAEPYPYTVVRGPRGMPRMRAPSGLVSAEEISAHVLRRLRAAAEASSGGNIRQAVITVPANFNDRQRQATRDAGRLAGFDVRRIISEPTAAVLAYGIDRQDDSLVLAYDFGGGTFDVSILEIRAGTVQVLSTAGDPRLGGDEIDMRIADWLVSVFERSHGVAPANDPGVRVRLLEAAEQAKITLSSALEADIRVPFLPGADGQPHNLEHSLTRTRLEAMIQELVDATMQACQRALTDAKLRPHDVQDVLLVGGSSRIPAVRRAIERLTGKEPRDAIAPDEIVAMGAAVQGGILTGQVQNLSFRDVLPLSLGIQTAHGSFTRVVPRNTQIPTRVTRTFSTARDNQKNVGLHLLQGERSQAAENTSLGQFVLRNLPDLPRGVPRVEVTFDVDADGILHVSAREATTGQGKRVAVRSQTGLKEAEIQKILTEAASHRDQDERAERLAEARNLVDGVLLELESALATPTLSKERKEALEPLATLAQDVMNEEDPELLKTAADEVLRVLRPKR